MANYNDQLDRMKGLMSYGKINENNHINGAIEYHTISADGKTYGIIRENTKYYIKTTETGKENVVESYEYIGGWCNRKDNEYTSYANALKQLQLKMMSINEAVGVHTNVQALNPEKKEELVIEGTKKMQEEIARQRQIMRNAGMNLNEETAIGFKNTGVPEAPKTANGLPKDQSQPYTEKGVAKLDKDLTATATKPEKQGTPFKEDAKVTDSDMQSDKNPKGGDDELEDAKYVPDNSVANQKPSGGKVVKVNEAFTSVFDKDNGTEAADAKRDENGNTTMNSIPLMDVAEVVYNSIYSEYKNEIPELDVVLKKINDNFSYDKKFNGYTKQALSNAWNIAKNSINKILPIIQNNQSITKQDVQKIVHNNINREMSEEKDWGSCGLPSDGQAGTSKDIPDFIEECDEWGSCGLPSDGQAGTSKDIPNVLGEDINDAENFVGIDDEVEVDDPLAGEVQGENFEDMSLEELVHLLNDNNPQEMTSDVLPEENDMDNPQMGKAEEFRNMLINGVGEHLKVGEITPYNGGLTFYVKPKSANPILIDGIKRNAQMYGAQAMWREPLGLMIRFPQTEGTEMNNAFESRKTVNNLVENIVKRIMSTLNEARVANPDHIPFVKLRDKWFKENGMQPFQRAYNNVMMNYEDLHSGGDTGENGEAINFSPEEINEIWQAVEKGANKIIKVITRIQQGKHLNVPDEVLATYKDTIENNPEAAQEILNSVNAIKQLGADKWDKKYAQEADNDFNAKNNQWNQHKTDLGFGDNNEDEIESLERKDKEYYSAEKTPSLNGPSRKDIKSIERDMETFSDDVDESKKRRKSLRETTLNDFGKHPGYRKKPMNLPKTDDGTPEGYADWNDESAKSEEPFGKEIGSSAPFEVTVKMLTDSIMKKIQEVAKKKS